jgi:branched-chain amino acid transport system substrate-binding protein
LRSIAVLRSPLRSLTAAIAACVLFLAFGLSACASADAEPAVVRIGVIVTQAGEKGAASGEPTIEAARLAVQEINRLGGLSLGGTPHLVELVIEDDDDRPEQAVVVAHRLINQAGVVALVGPQFSQNAIAVAAVADHARVPMLAPMATNQQVSNGREFVRRLSFSDDFQGRMMARFAREHRMLARIAVLFDVSREYNRSVAQAFREEFERLGGAVTAFEEYTSDRANDFVPQLNRVRASGADALFLPNYPEDVRLQITQAAELGFAGEFLGTDTWSLRLLQDIPPVTSHTIHHWNPRLVDSIGQAFIARYHAATGRQPTATAAATYDAFQLLFRAVQAAGRLEPEAIAAALAGITEHDGASGLIRYTAAGEPTKAAYISRFGTHGIEPVLRVEP